MAETKARYPGETDEAHPEKFDIRAMPVQPVVLKPGQLPEAQIRHFFEKGYLILHNYFCLHELEACRSNIETVVEDLAQVLFKAGKITDMHKDAGLFERLTLIEKQYKDANVLLHKPRTKHGLYQGFRNLWANDKILNLMEQLIGPEIVGNPVWNIRAKLPGNDSLVIPWHQDAGYTDNELYDFLVPTAWIPLLDANKENGCLELMSGGHKTGRVARHIGCCKETWYLELPEDEMAKTLEVDLETDRILCEVPYGGLILFNNLIPHRGLPNVSQHIRWSLDLRWMAPSEKCGWYGKDGILMRSLKTPVTVTNIDWNGFLEQNERDKEKEEAAGEPMFDPIFTSPYMLRWEMTNCNKHVQRFFQQEAKKVH